MCNNKKLIAPPSDPLRDVFNEEVRVRLGLKVALSKDIEYRLNVLTASGPDTSDPSINWQIRHYRAQRAAWDVYLYAAFACGLFEGADGADLRARLTSDQCDNFRAAMAECIACWVFSGKYQMDIECRPAGRKGRKLEFIAINSTQDLHVEVKAPFRERPDQGWSGNDSDLIEKCVAEASEQFKKGECNILTIVPKLRFSAYSMRGQLIEALYGQDVLTFPIDTGTGSACGPVTTKFRPDGRLLKRWRPEKLPRHKRISAVLIIEEHFCETADSAWFDHNILVLHNPNASIPCDPRIWGDIPQFIRDGDSMKWTDGRKLFP